MNATDVEYLYVFSFGKYFKVGVSKDVVLRKKTLQANLPERLIVLCILDFGESYSRDIPWTAERSIHESLSSYRLNGEWFIKNKKSLRSLSDVISILVGHGVAQTKSIRHADFGYSYAWEAQLKTQNIKRI